MKIWIKRYVTSCLIAMFVLGVLEGYHRPDKDIRMGAIILYAVAWPIPTAIIVGSTVGEIVSDFRQGKVFTDVAS
jgi:hypothetical protein